MQFMGCGTLKSGRNSISVVIIAFSIIVLSLSCFSLFARGQSETAFTTTDKFNIPGTSSPSTISFSINGTYMQASIENGAWKFVGLSFRNSTQQGKLNLTVSAQDSNLTITSYRTSTAGNTTMGNVRINYIVEGNGTQTFNFGTIPKGGYWNIIFNRVYIGQHEGWDVSPDGTLTVTGAASRSNVTVVYYTVPKVVEDISNQPIYMQHSVAFATGGAVTSIGALCLIIWRKNQKSSRQNQSLTIGTTTTHTDLTVKGRLINFGDGVLEFTENGIKFYVETGRFRKRRKIVREMPLADVESVERQGNNLSIVWKDATDTFVVAQPSQVESIHERITAALKERKKKQENKATVSQQGNELVQMTANAMEAADSLFDILKNLHGRVDWKLVENSYKQSEENVARLTNQTVNSIYLDVKPLSVAVENHRAKETAEKAYDVLRALHDHFDGMASSVEDSEQFHPNRRDAKLLMQAFYVLNDMALGAVVDDEAVEKEGAELLKVLDDLQELPGLKVDVNAVKTAIDKLCGEKQKQRVAIEEIMPMLQQQLKELIRKWPTQNRD
jgi:hypothetical protein